MPPPPEPSPAAAKPRSKPSGPAPSAAELLRLAEAEPAKAGTQTQDSLAYMPAVKALRDKKWKWAEIEAWLKSHNLSNSSLFASKYRSWLKTTA